MNLPERIFSSRRITRRLTVGAAFFASLISYLITLEPDASYWDCPEYLVTAALLEVGHPPGNPVWTLTARIFSLFGGHDPRAIAIAVNASSAIFTALAVGILASVIFILLATLFSHSKSIQIRRIPTNLICASASWGGAMCFGWADSPWFSAVEAEVYAMSLFLTALVIRLMIGWANMPRGRRSQRHLLLIVYLTGLSIGVHQLNLLVIPALSLIWLFRRRRGKVGFGRILTALIAGCAAVGLILLGMMPGVIRIAGQFELFCVNSLHWPLHSGVWLFWATSILIFWLLPFCVPPRRTRLQVIAWIPAMLLTGYSSYMILLVRSAANPPMNEAAPSTIFDLQSYLARDQYGSTPLFYGRTPKSVILRQERINPDGSADYSRYAMRDGNPHYAPTDSGYVLYEYSRIPVYTPELNMWLPRLTSNDPSDIQAYADWAGMTSATMKSVEVSYALDSLGNPVGRLLPDGSRSRETELRPTYLQQLQYLFGYQIGYMYFRYLLWNYSGRQNDRFAVGEVEHGNFITGLSPIDDLMLGRQDMLPKEIGRDNPGRNVYFMIPLLLGILGMVMLQRSGRLGRRSNFVIAILFLMTGLAIVVYLNQSPREPRERDYSFLGSLWAYAIWIGAGMALLLRSAFRYGRGNKKRNTESDGEKSVGVRIFREFLIGGAFVVSLGMPLWMLAQNFDDHDRSGRHATSDFAINFLESLEPNAILFTNGDNYTFPLWWAQEVWGVRRDVTIINTAYLGTSWYINQLRGTSRGAEGLRMQMPADELRLGGFKFARYDSSPECPSRLDSLSAVDASEALRLFYAAPADARRLPAMLRLANPEGGDSLILRSSAVASGSGLMYLRQLAALDIFASNASASVARPVYWQCSLSASDFAGLRPFTTRTLYTRRLVYTDSLSPATNERLIQLDMDKALTTRAGHRVTTRRAADGSGYEAVAGRFPYVDDTFGQMLTGQRQSLLRLGGRLLKAGRPADALRIARLTDSIFPSRLHEYRMYAETDSAIDEGPDLARLYLESARRLRPTSLSSDSDYQRGIALLRRERGRYLEWHRYRRSLPQRLQGVMTPKNLNKTRRVGRLDSLLKVYSIDK